MTCDNASNNDVMIDELQELIPEFAGSVSHTRCFLHIVNLIAKLLIRQFDAKKAGAKGDHKMAELQRELEEEEAFQNGDIEIDDKDKDDDNDDELAEKKKVDNDEGWVDEAEEMTEKEKDELEKSIQPVKLALVKVRLSSDCDLPLILILLRSAPQGCLQNCPLDDKGPPSLERDLVGSSLHDQFDAQRCCNPLEFNFRPVGVCLEASQGGRITHTAA